MENKKKIKIVIGDIIKLLNININISFKQFLDVVRGTLFLNKEDNFHLKYGKTELNEMNYKEIISSSKIKLDLIMEGRSFILKSIYSKNNFLKEDLDGISQTIYDYDKLNNFTMPNEFFERINKLETTIIQKIESNQNSMNKKFNDIKNGNKTIINYLKNNLEKKEIIIYLIIAIIIIKIRMLQIAMIIILKIKIIKMKFVLNVKLFYQI